MANYRVEKDGRTFYISPELSEFYANKGYRVFKPLELEITNNQAELRKAGTLESAAVAEQIDKK